MSADNIDSNRACTGMTRPPGPRIAIITVSKGRLDHLRQSLPLMLGQGADEVVVVDYGCPEGSGDWVAANFPAVRVVRIGNDPGFNISRARNCGVAACDARWICCLDADILLRQGWIDWLRPRLVDERIYFRASRIGEGRAVESWGMACVSRSAFERIGGYDEAFSGWGGEDNDYFERLAQAGFRETSYPREFLGWIPHDDAARTRFYAVKNKVVSQRAGLMYSAVKKPLGRLLATPLPLAQRQELMEAALAQVRKLVENDPLHAPRITVRIDAPADEVFELGANTYRIKKELVVTMEPIPDAAAAPPLISCLMITRGRTEFVRQAVGSFVRQTYPNKELIIVGNVDRESLETTLKGAGRPTIRVLPIAAPEPALGELRNTAVAAAAGRYICQWDDDDLYDPQRLELQYAALARSGARACLLNRWLLWWPAADRLAVSAYRDWEGSLLCEKAAMPRYPSLRRGEDTLVIERLRASVRLVTIDQPRLYVYVIHGGNTCDTGHFEAMYRDATERHEGDHYRIALERLKPRLAIAEYQQLFRSPKAPVAPSP